MVDYQTVLVPTDESDAVDRALDTPRSAVDHDATVSGLDVVDGRVLAATGDGRNPVTAALRAEGERAAAARSATAVAGVEAVTTVREGTPDVATWTTPPRPALAWP